MINSVAWLLRFKTLVCWKYDGSNSSPTGRLTTKDTKKATKQIAKLFQWDAFPEAMKKLSAEKRMREDTLIFRKSEQFTKLKTTLQIKSFL